MEQEKSAKDDKYGKLMLYGILLIILLLIGKFFIWNRYLLSRNHKVTRAIIIAITAPPDGGSDADIEYYIEGKDIPHLLMPMVVK